MLLKFNPQNKSLCSECYEHKIACKGQELNNIWITFYIPSHIILIRFNFELWLFFQTNDFRNQSFVSSP